MNLRIYETGLQGVLDGCRVPGQHQATFLTPLKDLPRFISLVTPFLGELQSARFRIDLVVFDPQNLTQLTPDVELCQGTFHGDTIEVEGADNCLHVLQLALSDWVDFLFTPDPATMQIYADHDEYITFFTDDKQTLKRIVKELSAAGYQNFAFRRTIE